MKQPKAMVIALIVICITAILIPPFLFDAPCASQTYY